MKELTLEEYLQDNYGLKGPLYRKRPWIDREGCRHWWTKAGADAYERFVHSIYNLENMAQSQGWILHDCCPVNYSDFSRLIKVTDFYEFEDPSNG